VVEAPDHRCYLKKDRSRLPGLGGGWGLSLSLVVVEG